MTIDSFEVDVEANSPSSDPKSLHTRCFTRTQEIIELDDIPPIIKSANGNLFWADEQCTRRVGPTATEARLFLKLLQMDEPEMLNYSDYKVMFDDFHREKVMLEKLVEELPWWRVWRSKNKKKVWLARIEWLEKIREPRLWLLYLMARRRRFSLNDADSGILVQRILQQATVAIMVSLKKKGLEKPLEFIPLQFLAMPAFGAMGIGTRSANILDEARCHVDIDRVLQEYKKKLEYKFGARPLGEVLRDYMTHSDQESLARRVPGNTFDGSQDIELVEVKKDPKEPQVVMIQVDGPPSPAVIWQTGKNTAQPEVQTGIEQSTPTRSKIPNIKRGFKSSVRSSIHSRQRGWSHSSDQTARPRIPGRCPIFNMRFEATRKDIKRQVELLMPKPMPYIVVGWFLRSTSDPREQILQFERSEEIFQYMRNGEADVRGWRRFISLKTLKGFGLYKCDVERGAHRPLILSTTQKAIVSQFYLAYRASYRHADDAVAIAWQGWVHKNLNGGKENPLEGKYSLQLIYNWSSYRLTLIVAIPVMLSLVVGLWYNGKDVGAAWTIAGYIISAAALVAALLAIIGSLKDT